MAAGAARAAVATAAVTGALRKIFGVFNELTPFDFLRLIFHHSVEINLNCAQQNDQYLYQKVSCLIEWKRNFERESEKEVAPIQTAHTSYK